MGFSQRYASHSLDEKLLWGIISEYSVWSKTKGRAPWIDVLVATPGTPQYSWAWGTIFRDNARHSVKVEPRHFVGAVALRSVAQPKR